MQNPECSASISVLFCSKMAMDTRWCLADTTSIESIAILAVFDIWYKGFWFFRFRYQLCDTVDTCWKCNHFDTCWWQIFPAALEMALHASKNRQYWIDLAGIEAPWYRYRVSKVSNLCFGIDIVSAPSIGQALILGLVILWELSSQCNMEVGRSRAPPIIKVCLALATCGSFVDLW